MNFVNLFQNEDIPMADMAYPEAQSAMGGGIRPYTAGPGQNPPPVSH